MGLKAKILISVLLLGVLICAGVVWQITQFSQRQTTRTSLATAQSLERQVRELRGYYTDRVVSAAQSEDLLVTHDYADQAGAIPLPATMVHELNAILTDKEGYTIRLYSEFPFPFRLDGGAHDDFEHRALEVLKANPDEFFWRQEEYGGVPSIRYAGADRMVAPACVNCHNTHPLSPKTDWRIGDVRGVIEVIIPIDEALRESEAAAIDLSLLVAVGVLTGLFAIGMVVHRVISPLQPVEERAHAIAAGDLKQATLPVTSSDEIGRLAEAFNQMLANLRHLTEQAQAIAEDDLNNEVLGTRVHGDLGDAFVEMVEGMKGIARQARLIADRDIYNPQLGEGTGTLGSSMAAMVRNLRTQIEESERLSKEIEQRANEAQAHGEEAESQRRHMHDVATQLTDLLNDQANSARQASQAANQASGAANQGAAVVQGAMNQMEQLARRVRGSASTISGLGESSSGISSIVAVISEIADQTRLLAMNATIEAAHAGEYGHGFTVVANEVRELARRISTATGEIDQMVTSIQASTEDVVNSMHEGSAEAEKAVEMAAESGQALRQISAGVNRVDQLVGQLSASIADQAETSSTLMQNAAGHKQPGEGQ